MIDDCEEDARTRSNHSVPPLSIINHNSSIIIHKKPSAHGRSEIFPAMNRLLTPAGNVRSDGEQPRDGTAPSSFAPEPPLFFSVFSTPSGSYPSEFPDDAWQVAQPASGGDGNDPSTPARPSAATRITSAAKNARRRTKGRSQDCPLPRLSCVSCVSCGPILQLLRRSFLEERQNVTAW
jgi:hypothetical protein